MKAKSLIGKYAEILEHDSTLVALQDISYEPPSAQYELWGGIPHRILVQLLTAGYITIHPLDTGRNLKKPHYCATDEGRAALDALRRAHPEASPSVYYRS